LSKESNRGDVNEKTGKMVDWENEYWEDGHLENEKNENQGYGIVNIEKIELRMF
jgi:hypothetical protein